MRSLSALTIAALLSAAMVAALGNPPPAHATPGATRPAPGDALLWSVAFTDPMHLSSLADSLDIWDVDHAAGSAKVMLSRSQAIDLSEQGEKLSLTERRPQGALVGSAAEHDEVGRIPGFTCYRTVDRIGSDMHALAAAHPNLAAWRDIGDSWDKIHPAEPEGHDIHALVITNRESKAHKSKLMVVAALHARELVTAEIAARFGEYLVARYGADPDVTWLLDYNEIHIVPVANPDGRRFAEQLFYWRKNTNSSDGCPLHSPGSYGYGVDLNRNFGLRWNACTSDGCSSDDPCSPTYRGSGPASEPETRFLRDYGSRLFPDQRPSSIESSAPITATGILLSLHSYGELVMFPWGWTDAPTPNDSGLRATGARLAEPLGYRSCQIGEAGCLYQVDGGLEDWAYGSLGIRVYRQSSGTEFFQSCTYFEERILHPALDSLTLAAKYSRMPYALSVAPQVNRVDLSQSLIAQGAPLTLTVSLDSWITQTDTAAGFQYVLDSPSWVARADEVVQVLSADLAGQHQDPIKYTVDTSSWALGRRLLFVEGISDNGSAGTPVAMYVDVVSPHISFLPVVTERRPWRPGAAP